MAYCDIYFLENKDIISNEFPDYIENKLKLINPEVCKLYNYRLMRLIKYYDNHIDIIKQIPINYKIYNDKIINIYNIKKYDKHTNFPKLNNYDYESDALIYKTNKFIAIKSKKISFISTGINNINNIINTDNI